MDRAVDRAGARKLLSCLTDEQMRIVDADEDYGVALGYERHALIGRDVLELTHPDDREINRERADALIAGGAPFSITKRYVGADGRSFWVTNHISLFHAGNTRRMMATVQSLGMQMAPDGCRPNILILFADNPQEQLLSLRTRSPQIFGDLTRPAVSRIVKAPGPVYAWNAAVRVSRDGDLVIQQEGPSTNWPEMKVGAASRLLSPVRQDIAASVVVIERKALLNKARAMGMA